MSEYAYIRVSTREQNIDRQLIALQCELHPYSDPELVHDFPLFQCDLPEAGFAIDRINDFFCLCRK